jgi:AcrR family transcriptional regulator
MAPRKYESQLRAQQSRDTRRLILESAARLTFLNVQRLTHAAVAKAAGVSERTVFRHFPTVAELHDGFAAFQEQQFGRDKAQDFTIDDLVPEYERWLDRIADSEALEYLLVEQKDPPFLTRGRRQRYARLERALAKLVPGAKRTQLRQLVLVFGALVSPEVFRRAKLILRMKPRQAVPGPAWAMRVLIEALQKGDTPWKQS